MEISPNFEPILRFLSGEDEILDCPDCGPNIKNMITASRVTLMREITKESITVIYSYNYPYAIYINEIPYDISAFRPDLKKYLSNYSTPGARIIILMAEIYYEKNRTTEMSENIIQTKLPRYLIFAESKKNKTGFVNIR